jgi:hypothetical protein
MSSRVEYLQKRHSDEPRREKHWRRCQINLHRSFPPERRTSIITKAAATHNPDPWISFCVCRRRCSLRPSCLQLQELATNFLTVAEAFDFFLLRKSANLSVILPMTRRCWTCLAPQEIAKRREDQVSMRGHSCRLWFLSGIGRSRWTA